ncbi:pro-corazonin-like [Toxorhynchites rutilus septentrionalis]|uniref:pro-corazonin-like n=1 Tax=Toxorhynchites rutilus septentrionalis TaxID=329112 RepID=UPI002478D6A0|nr:pro-corazonin-like [Toxorhynchites rutilus septentrionalis]
MRHLFVASVILSLLVIIVNAQTFQYSRGWKNGKRGSTETAVVNSPILTPRFITGLDKPTDKLLIQRFLKSPCVARLANALVNANQDMLQRVANDGDGSAILYDSNGAESAEEARFKRDTAAGQEYPGMMRF